LTTGYLVFLLTLDAFIKWLAGILLVVSFGVYVGSTAILIYKGTLVAPENNSEESDGDSDCGSKSDGDSDSGPTLADGNLRRSYTGVAKLGGHAPKLPPKVSKRAPSKLQRRSRPKPTRHHVLKLFVGLAALLLASYVVSRSAAAIGTELSLPDTVVGTTLVSFATSIPEKFVAVMGGIKKQPGIMIANTVGSNIFLVTLCGGILFLGGDLQEIQEAFTATEALVMWAAAGLMCGIVLSGANKWVGAAMLCCYVAFFVFEVSSGRILDD
jgi:hypothetical protein